MALTTAQHLELVQQAIQAYHDSELFKRYTEAGNQFVRVDYSVLVETEEKLLKRLAAETGTGIGAARHSLFEPMPQ